MFGFLFKKQADAPKNAAQERAQRTLEAFEQGTLPRDVVDRLEKTRQGNLPWTSDLSVNEWLALRPFQLEPIGQVMGSSVFHVGFVASQWGLGSMPTNHELIAPTQAAYEGKRLAMLRLEKEAKQLGANAVVGVRISQKKWSEEDRVIEYVSYGTAVHVEGLPENDRPMLASVSGQDFVRLLQANAVPIGVALGTSYYYVVTGWRAMRQERSFYNQEMDTFQEAVSTVRHLVIKRMKEEAVRLGGTGVISADFTLQVHDVPREVGENESVTDHIIDVSMLGSVLSTTSFQPSPAVSMTVNLRDYSSREL